MVHHDVTDQMLLESLHWKARTLSGDSNPAPGIMLTLIPEVPFSQPA